MGLATQIVSGWSLATLERPTMCLRVGDLSHAGSTDLETEINHVDQAHVE